MSTSALNAELRCLPEIFAGRFFIVPDYQRAYAWDERQVDELLRDIGHVVDDGAVHRHYTGTLVLGRIGDDQEAGSEYHVVDGQQRLTTLIVLLRALAEHLPTDDRDAFEHLYLRRGPLGSERFVLQVNSDTRQFFERVILGGTAPTHEPMPFRAHERLLAAHKRISSWIKEQIEAGTTATDLRIAVERRLGFLVYAPKEDAETGIMFEVINNRGKPLSELEKVKNYLIYCSVKLNAPTLRTKIDASWSEILRNLGNAGKTGSSDESAFLRYCVVVELKANKTDSQYGYDVLKSRLALERAMSSASARDAAIEMIDSFVGFLKMASLWYARLFARSHADSNAKLRPMLELLRSQGSHASIMPLFLAIVIRNNGSGEPMLRLLSLLERLNFRVYMARNITSRTDTGQGDLYAYASAYYHGALLAGFKAEDRVFGSTTLLDDHQALEYRLVGFVLYYANDEYFGESFRLQTSEPDDFYFWAGLRYFLMNYEQELQPNKTIQIEKIVMSRAEGKSADYLSVEHRWATENRSGEGENDRAVDSHERRRFGNFTLLELRLNIQAGKADLEEKIERYLGNGDEPGTDLQQVKRMIIAGKKALKSLEGRNRGKGYYLDLHRQINDVLENAMIAFALKRWSVTSFLGYRALKRELEGE